MTTPLSTHKQHKRLPIGIQTFANIREGSAAGDDVYYYVDKTKRILELVKERAVFLSRPRRFGKSLTLDTIDELFSGNKTLFTGLYAENNWDWSQSHPVIRLSFGTSDSVSVQSVDDTIDAHLTSIEKKFAIAKVGTSHASRLQSVIQQCYEQTGKTVVILIDEYDKPLLDSLDKLGNWNKENIVRIRDLLRSLYGAIKDNEKYIRFAMLTGVSQFSKVNVFSGLNHLNDITLQQKYSALCGYTQTELETVFAPHLTDVDMDKLKRWYNGYNWTGESVYNPFDVLFFLNEKRYSAYWYKTGSTTFFIDYILKSHLNLAGIEQRINSEALLSQFDIDNTDVLALLFQTGYLTIADHKEFEFGHRYMLKFPNIEVQQSLNETLLKKYIANGLYETSQSVIIDALINKDFDELNKVIQSMLASIPHDWYRKNNIAHYEGHWASVFYMIFASLALTIVCEDATNQGQIDMTVDFHDALYIFEFKVLQTGQRQDAASAKLDSTSTSTSVSVSATGCALQQIKDKHYADKYRSMPNHKGKEIYLLGVHFNKSTRNIMTFEWERFA